MRLSLKESFAFLSKILNYLVPFVFGCFLLSKVYLDPDHEYIIWFCILGLVFILASQLPKFEYFQFLSLKIKQFTEIKSDIEQLTHDLRELSIILTYHQSDFMSKVGRGQHYTLAQQLNNLHEFRCHFEKIQVDPKEIKKVEEVVYKDLGWYLLHNLISNYIHKKDNDNKRTEKTQVEKKLFTEICKQDVKSIQYLQDFSFQKVDSFTLYFIKKCIKNLKSLDEVDKEKLIEEITERVEDFHKIIEGNIQNSKVEEIVKKYDI